MANMWDDFWGNLGSKADKLARSHPLVGGAMDGIGNINKGIGKVYWDSDSERNPNGMLKHPLGMINIRDGEWSKKPQQNQPLEKLAGLGSINNYSDPSGGMTRQGHDENMTNQTDEDKLLQKRADIEALLDQDYVDDPESKRMIEEAYASALANISGARTRANDNFAKSDANIAALSAGHVNTIKTDDLNAVKRIGGELKSGITSNNEGVRESIQDDRSREIAEKTAALQRLGIQEAGLGDAGRSQSEAISKNAMAEQGMQNQASVYQAADETRNTEQAQSQASAGVERRSALHNDLQKILGNIDQSEADIQGKISQDKLQSHERGLQDFRQQQQFNLDSLENIDDRLDQRKNDDRDYDLKLKELAAKNNGSGGVFEAVDNNLTNRGVDPAPYKQTYADVASNETFNAAVDGDKKLWMIRKMKAKNPKLDAREIQAYVLGVENYGTDKLGN